MSGELERRQKLEAVGNIRASRFITRYSKTSKQIGVAPIIETHKLIFKDSSPTLAGRYRREPVTIKGSKHRPPHYEQVPGEMKYLGETIRERESLVSPIKWIHFMDETISESEKDLSNMDQIIDLAAWAHYRIVYIHPFLDGNGRTARLITNLIVQRLGFVGLSIKIERENKNKYYEALAQIDDPTYNDYEPLKTLIYEGLIERYDGVVVEY